MALIGCRVQNAEVERGKQQAVERIKSSGVPYSIFYPSTLMENFDKGAYRQGNNIVLAGTSKYKMYLISGQDYGKQVVKAFQLDNGAGNTLCRVRKDIRQARLRSFM